MNQFQQSRREAAEIIVRQIQATKPRKSTNEMYLNDLTSTPTLLSSVKGSRCDLCSGLSAIHSTACDCGSGPRYTQPLPGHALFHGCTTVSVAEVSVLQARVCVEQLATIPTKRHELCAFPV